MREKKQINIQIGEQVRLAREQADLTQEQLAERLEVSPQYVSDLERGVVGPSIATLKKLCGCLAVTSDRLLFGTESADRGAVLSAVCSGLTDRQFELLLEIAEKYTAAVDLS